MKVLVTGGAGFIGSHVVDTLIEAGHHVVIVDNLWEHGGGKMENVNPKASFHMMDIRDAALQRVFEEEQPEAICHLAAQHSVKISTDDPAHDASVNILGLINLLQNATRFGVQKVVFSSSGATYGTVEKMPVDESTTRHPESPYGTTKMASEYYLRFWKNMYGLDFTILRYGNVYGPRQDPMGEAGVIAIFSRQIMLNESVRIDWDGEQQKDYVYVGDVARANLLALENGSGEAYCIAYGQGTSVNALYRGLVNEIGHEVEIRRAPKRPGDIYLTYFDCSKAGRELGWQAEVGLEEGLRSTVNYFREKLGVT
ncbi:MAG TPA: GDP-mannose 4,6-dehydratase [Anaerolineales bacterium]|nr:GDP-mannose 4,6-dehydratase [Anaerolineales bacterium]